MVAIFTGLGAGFERGSRAMLGSAGLLGSGAFGRNGEELAVNAATGNLLISQRDEFLVGRGPDVAIARTYNSFADAPDDNGDNWRQSTDRRVHDLNNPSGTVKRTSADGSDITYTFNGSVYVATDGAGANDTLSYAGGVWTWTDGDTRATEKYEAYGSYWRITEAADTVANKLTFTYSGANLYRVTTQDGSYEQYNWTGSNITQIVTGYTDLVTSTAKTLTRARYDYDGSNRLIKVTVDLTPEDNSVTDGATYVTNYSYDGTSKRVAQITETDGSQIDITYDTSGRVSAIVQTVATGVTRTTYVAYTVNPDGSGSATITDPLSKTTTVEWNIDGSMKKVTSPPAYSGATPQVVQFYYTSPGSGNVSSIVDATGAITSYTYDGQGNVASMTDPLLNVVTRTYGTMNELLTETRTGSDSASSGASHTVRFVYDSYDRLVFTVDPVGRVTQNYYDAYSNLIRTEAYTDSLFDLSAYGSSTPITLATMTSWDASVAGDRTNVQNVVNTYDARGNLTGTTTYAIASSTGATSTADGTGQTSSVYDQAGQLLNRTIAGQNTETFEYDGLWRTKRTVDVNGNVATITFGDAAMQTVVAMANGFTQTSIFDRAGELVSFAETGDYVTGGTATYAYDQRGQVHVTTDATGHKSYTYYDALGRKIADIDQYGATTEYKYDAENRVVLTIRYATVYLVPPSGGGGGGHFGGGGGFGGGGTGSPTPPDYAAVTDFATIRPTADPADMLKWTVYDADGRVIESIAGDGSVTTYQYDASSRLVGTTSYVNKLSASTLATIRATPPSSAVLPTADSAHDVVARSFYDKSGLLIGTLDGEGFVSRIDYDKAGRQVAETVFATVTASGLRASGTFDALIASAGTSSADRISRSVYDGQGNLRFSIDALNHVVEYVYDSGTLGQANGPVRQTIRYAGTISALADYRIGTVKTAVAALASDTNNRKSWAVYDAAGRLAYAIDGTGAVLSYGYNGAGQVIKTVQFATARTTTTLPDKATMDSWSTANIAAADNRITRGYYAARGELRFSVDAEGYVTRLDYDAEGRVVGTVKWTTPIATTDSTTIANVTTLATGTFVTTTTVYDNDGRVSTVTDEEGFITSNVYNITGTLSQVFRPYSIVPPSGGGTIVMFGHVETSFDYDNAGRVIAQHENAFWYPDYNEQPITAYAYDGLGNVVSITDPNGTVTTRSYDRDGRMLGEVRAAGAAEQASTFYAYNGFGDAVSVTDPNGNTTTRSFDRLGQVLSETDPFGGAVSYDYNSFGNAVKITDERGYSTYNYFDKAGRVTTSRDAEDYVTETIYTSFGDIASVTRRYNQATGAASVSTLPTYTLNPTYDATTLFEYDRRGIVKKSTDAMGFYEQYTLDFGGRRLTSRNKLGGVTTNVYDKRGLLVSETLPINSVRSDGTVEATSITNHYEYDGRGNRTLMVEAYGLTEQRTTSFVYDKLDRLISTIGDAVQNGTGTMGTPFESAVYDLNGNVIERLDATGAATLYYYDKLNRVILQVDALGNCTTFTYTSNPGAGSTTVMRAYATPLGSLPPVENRTPPVPSGSYRETVSVYDKLGRLKTTSIAGIRTGAWVGGAYATGTGTLTTTLDYDAAGNVIKTTDANGGIVYSYYDKLGRKTAQVDAGLALTGWTLDGDGNVLVEKRFAILATSATTGTPPTVTPDAADRRTTFTYDKNGRRLTEARAGVVAYTVDPSSGVLSAPSTVSATIYYSYNGLGEVTSKREATDLTATITYTYDVGGRLITEQRAAYSDYQSATATPTVDYAYDGLGNLTRTRQSGDANPAVARVTTYTYGAGGRLTAMTDATGATRNYFYDLAGRKVAESYSRVNSAGTAVTEGVAYTYDLLGRLTSQAACTGAWAPAGDVSQIAYNAFGEVSARGVNGLQEQFEYDGAGHLWRSNSGDGVWRYFITDGNGNQTLAIESTGTDLAGKSIHDVLTIATSSGAVTVGATYIAGINATVTVFDKRNQVTSAIQTMRQRVTGVAAANVTAARTYNAFGEVLTETDPRGTTTYSYNTMGRTISIVRPSVTIVSEAGTSSSATPTDLYYYDVSGRLIGARDANLNLTTHSLVAGTGYGQGEVLVAKEFHADGGVVTNRYDAYGDLRTVVDEVGRSTTNVYDGVGRLTQVTHFGGLVDAYGYDALGQRITHWNNLLGSGNVEATDYDAQGRVISSRAFGGDVTTISYVWNGSLATAGLGTFGGWTETTTYANGRTAVEVSDVFTHTISKTDMGAHATAYTYDLGGRLTERAGGETQRYTYFNTGLAASVSTGTGTGIYFTETAHADYGYDSSGLKLTEYATSGGAVVQNATVVYDALGRMLTWNEIGSSTTPAAHISWSYDAVGNIREENTTYSAVTASGTTFSPTSQDHWFRYDVMNRVVTANGIVVGGQVVRGYTGTDLLYDVAGQRTQAINTVTAAARVRREDYTYDSAGNLAHVKVAEATYTDNYNGTVNAAVFGTAQEKGSYSYDLMNRMTRQQDWTGDYTGVAYDHQIYYNASGQVSSESIAQKQGTDTYTSTTTNSFGSGTGYALGAAISSTTTNAKNGTSQPTTSTTNSFAWYDGAVQSSVAYKPDTGASTTYTTAYNYSGAGVFVSAHVMDGRDRWITVINDALGQVIKRDEADTNYSAGDPHEIWYRFNGREIGHDSNNGSFESDYRTSIDTRTAASAGTGAFKNGSTTGAAAAQFGDGYDPITSYDQGSGGGSYTVRAGDTLASIAAQLWGDSSLWYELARANGLSAASGLIEGQTLNIPSGVTKSSNSASTFKPYDPGDAYGDTSPTTPKPGKKNKCGVFGLILLAVIAVAVTVVSAGAALSALVPSIGGIGSGIGAVFGAGGIVGALGGGIGGLVGGIAIGAASAALGSIVSQGIGVATGIQDKFSWKAVGLAAIGGGVGAGIGGSGLFDGIKSGIIRAGVSGAVSSAVTQGIGVATGLQSKFSWAGVAAAGVGAMAGYQVGKWLGAVSIADDNTIGNYAANLAASGASMIADAATRSVIEGSDFGDNLLAALPDVIAQTIGDLLFNGVSRSSGPDDDDEGGDYGGDDAGAGDDGMAHEATHQASATSGDGDASDGADIVVTGTRASAYDPLRNTNLAGLQRSDEAASIPRALLNIAVGSNGGGDDSGVILAASDDMDWDGAPLTLADFGPDAPDWVPQQDGRRQGQDAPVDLSAMERDINANFGRARAKPKAAPVPAPTPVPVATPDAGGQIGKEWPVPGGGRTPKRGDVGPNGKTYSDGAFNLGGTGRSGRAHKGMDLPGKVGDPVRSAADGVVVINSTQMRKVWAKDAKGNFLLNKKGKHYKVRSTTETDGWGNFVVIRHPDGYQTLYAHLDKRSPLRVGTRVSKGQVIGQLGVTGNARNSGSHLHFEVHVRPRGGGLGPVVNPRSWINGKLPRR